MTRRRRRNGLAAAAVALLVLGADLLASDLPLAVRVDGATFLAPCLFRPRALAGEDQQTLARRAAWILRTPIPYGPLASRPGDELLPLSPPSLHHLLGTDDRGRDVAARLLHGGRTALTIGLVAVALTLALGLLVGVAGAVSPRLDLLLSRLIEVGLTFPTFFLLLAIQGTFGAPSALEVAVAIALTQWPHTARLSRGEARRAMTSPHVEAARGLGASAPRIALFHVLPFALGPALASAAFGLGQAVLIEAALSYLGFGVPPPSPSWGELLAEAWSAGLPWWLVLPPSLAIAATVIACQQIADRLRRLLVAGPASRWQPGR